MSRFYEIDPTPENYWRAIILFGRNTASYKFALAKALLELHGNGKSQVKLEELAVPYAKHLAQHIKQQPKQITSKRSSFLEQITAYNQGQLDHDGLIQQTTRLGFNNVIDAFHKVHGNDVGSRFFIDQRRSHGGIELTDNLNHLLEQLSAEDLAGEVEARWRLVEEAWANNLSRQLMLVEYEEHDQQLIGIHSQRRISLTSARPALNGYQKGRCFYCYREISILYGSDTPADVDHFFPHKLKRCDDGKPIDGVANLVLACTDCNRGAQGKFDQIPALPLLERLHTRNEYLISSHHPLRETLIAQTGASREKRQDYLQDAYNCATVFTGSWQKWQPRAEGVAVF
ncbi:HNH endonuclease [Ectothiorhodospiraceae bacterium BW-2]|nr:HNH endonuclease [Ectothiorhodospiraceae bacterium BW-2]